MSCLVLVLAAAGCGGGGGAKSHPFKTRTAEPHAAALCLDSDQFLVSDDGVQVSGSSPGGVNFVVHFYKTPARAAAARAKLDPAYSATIASTVIDFSGNPPLHRGGAPMGLIPDDLRTLQLCLEPPVHG